MTAVLLVTGPVGVGKSAVLNEADVLLNEARIPHATIVLEEIARLGPPLPGDPYNAHMMRRNLASVWSNYAATGGAERLLLEKLVARRSDLGPLLEAVPGAELSIIRLRAPLAVIEDRVRRRDPSPQGELSGARWWAPRMERWAIEDFLVENDDRQPREVAAEVLRLAGWLPSPA